MATIKQIAVDPRYLGPIHRIKTIQLYNLNNRKSVKSVKNIPYTNYRNTIKYKIKPSTNCIAVYQNKGKMYSIKYLKQIIHEDINTEVEESETDMSDSSLSFNNLGMSIGKFIEYNILKGSLDFVKKNIIFRYGYLRKLESEYNFDVAENWLNKYNQTLYNNDDGGYKYNYIKKFLFFKIDKETFVFVTTSNNNEIDFNEIYASYKNYNKGNFFNYGYVYIFGKRSKKYIKEFKSQFITKYHKMYTVTAEAEEGRSGSNRITSHDLKPRKIDTLFFDDNIKGALEDHINKFDSNNKIYDDRDIIYKTGILLYGQPGTGKSSLANVLATYCDCDIINIDISMFYKIDVAELVATLNADDCRYIVLLEDIDTIFDSLDRNNVKNKSEQEKAVINKLLQLLDSNSSPTNVIFVATTNYYDKLDDAIKREGRFDLKLEIKPISKKSTAEKMCRSFELNDNQIKDIIDNIEYPIVQSSLQNKILKKIENNLT